jgi:hypothetical protein
MILLERYMCLFNSPEYSYLEEEAEPISTMKYLSCRNYSFQKLSQFAQGNNVLDAPPSNTDGVFFGNTCVSSTWLNR